jgi:hypothetical protein
VTTTLRALTAGDDDWLDAWLPAVAASVAYEGVAAEGAAASLRVRLREEKALGARIFERDGEPHGLIVFRRLDRTRVLIELVATPAALARKCAAMQAMALLEEELSASGMRTVFAPAPAVHGIAMYFWIRLGYRPLLRGEWPCVRAGVAWLRRDLVQPKGRMDVTPSQRSAP